MDAEPERKGRKRRRGTQSRLAQAEKEVQQESAVCALLMTLFAQGLMSGVLCHKVAQAAQKDIREGKAGGEFPDLDRLANLKQGKNLKRSVHGILAKSATWPMPMKVQMPYVDGEHFAHILLPHEMFAAFYENQEKWKESMLPDESKLPLLWSSLEGHPSMQAHPITKQKDYKSTFLPLTLHGDEVPVQGIGKIWCRSCLAFSWCSLLANALGGKCSEIMVYIAGFFEKFVVEGTSSTLGTMGTFWAILRWSFMAMWTGRWPAADWRGVPFAPNSPEGKRANSYLAGGYRACLFQFCGDLDYYSKWLGIPMHSNHRKPCSQCKCTFAGASTWMDNRINSPWQGMQLTTANWKQHWNTRCALFQLPGVSALSISMDLMHNMFLGWLQYAYGSVMYLLTHECLPGSPLDNLKTVASFIKEIQKGDARRYKYKQRLQKLTMFVKKKGFPKLKGRAADIMGLDLAMKSCWQQFMTQGNEQHELILLFLSLNVRIGDLLDFYSPSQGSFGLPEEEWKELVTARLQMAQIHVQLRDQYEEANRSLFNLTTKTHFCLHSFILSKSLHPSLVWCFKGESTMRTVQTLWKSCLSGNKHWAVGMVASLKYRHLLHLK